MVTVRVRERDASLDASGRTAEVADVPRRREFAANPGGPTIGPLLTIDCKHRAQVRGGPTIACSPVAARRPRRALDMATFSVLLALTAPLFLLVASATRSRASAAAAARCRCALALRLRRRGARTAVPADDRFSIAAPVDACLLVAYFGGSFVVYARRHRPGARVFGLDGPPPRCSAWVGSSRTRCCSACRCRGDARRARAAGDLARDRVQRVDPVDAGDGVGGVGEVPPRLAGRDSPHRPRGRDEPDRREHPRRSLFGFTD